MKSIINELKVAMDVLTGRMKTKLYVDIEELSKSKDKEYDIQKSIDSERDYVTRSIMNDALSNLKSENNRKNKEITKYKRIVEEVDLLLSNIGN